MARRAILVCLLTIAFLRPAAALAEHTRYWRQTNFSEFEKGTAKGVAIRSDGKLVSAPKFDLFADPSLAYVWSMRMDSKKRLYAAGGSDAKVLRFDDSGKPTTVFESTELAAQTIALDAADNLYVGTSPDGKVYQVTPDGKKSVFFEPKTKYIWALAVDPKGALFVATGDRGQVFAVTPDGKGQLFYQSRERHARSLAFDSRGNLLIGTDPDGLVVRVEIARKTPRGIPEAGASFVVYETSKAEVTSLLTDADGNMYAASIGEKSRAPVSPFALPSIGVGPQTTMSVISSQGAIVTPAQPVQQLGTYPFPGASTAGGAEVVKIGPDGSPEKLWSSPEGLVFSLGFSRTGKLLLGTGDTGTVIELEGNDVYSSVANTASAQVTSLIAGPDGKVFVATANAGKIFALGPGFEPSGSFESDIFDAKIFSHWGRLTWFGENAAAQGTMLVATTGAKEFTPHANVAFYVRSGNTSNPGDTWSPWAGPYNNPAGESVDCPPARFVQWKAVFLDTQQGSAPSVSWVNLAYLPKNVAPIVDDIAMQDPGIRVLGSPSQPSGPGSSIPVPLRSPRSAVGNPLSPMMNADSSSGAKIDILPQGFELKGYQGVLWSAHDDNDDDLFFTIYYRGEGEQNWRLLKDKLTQRYYSWDTATMPDGAYYLKIVASDAPSNPASQALWAERASDRWEVANTPPRVENLRAGSGILNTKASFDAISSSGPIAHAQFSIDSGDWQTIFPTGLLSDAPKESYFMELPGLTVGEHTLAVQVADRFDNTTTAKFTFTIPPHAN
jgi:sugar lactone lactonase YvrE